MKNEKKPINEDAKQCRVCFEQLPLVALVPCGHVILCENCAKTILGKNCPVCRKDAYSSLKLFF